MLKGKCHFYRNCHLYEVLGSNAKVFVTSEVVTGDEGSAFVFILIAWAIGPTVIVFGRGLRKGEIL